MSNLESIARKFLNMLPGGAKIPLPHILVVDTPSASWAGLSEWHHDNQVHGLIKVQKRGGKDEETLERIIAHEICHYWEFYSVFELGIGDPEEIGHGNGSLWKKAARIINGKIGDPDFVTEVSDSSYVFRASRAFYVMVLKGSEGLGWIWFSTITKEMMEDIATLVESGPVSVVKTDREIFLSSGAKLPFVGMATGDEDMERVLKHIFNYARNVSPDGVRDMLKTAPWF